MTAPVLPASPDAIARAIALLKRGGLVAMPTETVYGLACDAGDPAAVARLYAAKGRPAFNPLIAHVDGFGMAAREGVFSETARRLAETFWPGPLTLVVPLARTHITCELARAGLDTVAIRASAHPVARALIAGVGRPLVAPSANRSGHVSPTEAAHVAGDLGEAIDLILDTGACEHGLESTVIACLDGPPALLRPGALPAGRIEAVLGAPLLRPADEPGAPVAPGQLLRHYAPNARLRLNVRHPEPGEAWLAFGLTPVSGARTAATLNLSPRGDLAEAAANLFAMLRTLDRSYDRIAVSPIPDTGLGEAINDRLRRAVTR